MALGWFAWSLDKSRWDENENFKGFLEHIVSNDNSDVKCSHEHIGDAIAPQYPATSNASYRTEMPSFDDCL